MGSIKDEINLPESDSPHLHLDHPTPEECVEIYTNSWASWGDSLPLQDYLRESAYLSTIPLARQGGMTNWILVDKRLLPNQRLILCACESFVKHSVESDEYGKTQKVITHGIASVFCFERFRRRGYAERHMREVAKVLRSWKSEHGAVVGSVLYSDIGPHYYAKLGWKPNSTNEHLEFQPRQMQWPESTQEVKESDLAQLCERDIAMITSALATPCPGVPRRLIILPDLDHILWHKGKEDFATGHLFGKSPTAMGAIAGSPGAQVWVLWTHRYYGLPDTAESDNVLYILRLVVEGDRSANRPSSRLDDDLTLTPDHVQNLHDVLQAAQAEAATWKLDHVKLWEPSRWVQKALRVEELAHTAVIRQEDSIASGFWYGKDGDAKAETPVWVNNEHYAWC